LKPKQALKTKNAKQLKKEASPLNNLDKIINEALTQQAEKIPVYQCQIERVKNSLKDKEEITMKKSMKKTILITAAVCVLGSITAIAGSKFSGRVTHSSHNDDIKSYSQVAQLTEKADMDLKYPEEFSNGYIFDTAAPHYTHDVDGSTGKNSEEWMEIGISYKKSDSADVHFNATKIFDEVNDFDSSEEYNHITIAYNADNYLFLPPDEEPTEDEKALEEKGQLFISYGSSEREEKVIESVVWTDGEIQYSLMTFDGDLGESGLTEMAKEIIDR
jgi:hypothetical protein